VATVPVSASRLREQLPEPVGRDELAVLVVHVTEHIGPADPAVALSDGLRTYAAKRVVVIRHRPEEGRYLEDVPVAPAAEAFRVPLTEATVEPGRA
jgi:hypothetical protein